MELNKVTITFFLENPVRSKIIQEFTDIHKSTPESFFSNYSSALNRVRSALNAGYGGRTVDSHEYLTKLPEDWNSFIDSMPKSVTDTRYYFTSASRPILDIKA